MTLARVLAALVALAPGAAPAAGAWESDPKTAFEQLESRLLTARRVQFESELRASGSIVAELRGRMEFRPRNTLKVAYAGTFGSQAYELGLEADSRRAVITRGADRQEFATGAETNRALLLGLTRIGLLHNLLRLAHAQLPDHAQGGAARWVGADGFQPATYALDGPLEGALSFGFETMLGARAVAQARLWLDPATGLPRRREQSVQLEGGPVTVVEDYRGFVVD